MGLCGRLPASDEPANHDLRCKRHKAQNEKRMITIVPHPRQKDRLHARAGDFWHARVNLHLSLVTKWL